jgi:hypothetical protein
MNEDRDDDKWHLDKKVPISIIIAMIFQFVASLWFVARLDARVIALETAQVAQAERDRAQDANHNTSLGLIRDDMREIGRKLDRLVEREMDKK